MTLDEERNSSNKSNSTDDLSEEFLILSVVIQFFSFLFVLLMVVYLSVRLKKRAWDSPAKRFANSFSVCFALGALCIAVSLCSGVHYDNNDIILFILFLLSLPRFLYFIAMYVALSLQIVIPFLPERLKLCVRKTHCVKFTELTSHVLILFLDISFSVLNYYLFDFQNNYTIYAAMGIILIIFILSYSVLFLAFLFLMKFFKFHNNKKKTVRFVVIKIFFFFIICITYVIITVLADHYWSLLVLRLLHWVHFFILSILVISLNYPLDMWSCKCCFQRSSSRAPLLPVNDTERQQISPISVWDHRNGPSYTVTNLPYDMSDCRSDYEQLA